VNTKEGNEVIKLNTKELKGNKKKVIRRKTENGRKVKITESPSWDSFGIQKK
jgi:intein/homing endonuclease